ncbi:TSUP family transporter [Hymenobacter baengnokdamensis]|uniref:TSUP family transporter n=1 Tax=Hymenobacter baengnokdamensis TaxID=2615203 RepID=UPI001786F8D2|nr:TSUP family transporter [Hymenobacter baengnokdamensis]
MADLPLPPPADTVASTSPPPATGNDLFPVFLQLAQFRVLIIGGGRLATERLSAILRNSPATSVTIISPALTPALHELAAPYPQITLCERPWNATDFVHHEVLFIATDEITLNQQIQTESARLQLLTNVAGSADGTDFFLASVVRKGDLKIAISTNGQSPTVGKRLREVLEEALPGELAAVLQQMNLIRSRLQGDFTQKVKSLHAVTAELAHGPAYETPATIYWRRVATGALMTFAGFILLNILSYYVTWPQLWALAQSSTTFYTFVAVGFGAQLIDGLLGMGYGVVSAISLMSMGLHPAAVSASIHTAEMFASGASGYHHYRFGNVNKRLFRVLLLPGVAGSISGALLLTHFGDKYGTWIKPALAFYLLLLGVRIISKAIRKPQQGRRKVKNAGWLAGAGGFLDSFGGGGWGPLVTSTLIANGRTPQYVIGTVSLVEFFVTFASALTFFSLLGLSHWQIILGLIVGGVAAAPIAARLAGRIPTRFMFVGVGLMVIFWSLWTLGKIVMQ